MSQQKRRLRILGVVGSKSMEKIAATTHIPARTHHGLAPDPEWPLLGIFFDEQASWTSQTGVLFPQSFDVAAYGLLVRRHPGAKHAGGSALELAGGGHSATEHGREKHRLAG